MKTDTFSWLSDFGPKELVAMLALIIEQAALSSPRNTSPRNNASHESLFDLVSTIKSFVLHEWSERSELHEVKW